MSKPKDQSTPDPRPTPPVEPQLEDCCGNGCDPCVFDAYQMAKDRYRAALAAWEARQATSTKRDNAVAIPVKDNEDDIYR